MRVFEQKLCEVVTTLSVKKPEKFLRPKLVLRQGFFVVIPIMSLMKEDIIVCNLTIRDMKDGLSAGSWAAIERYIRMNFPWQEQVK